MEHLITASMLYDWVHCPHRIMLDLFSDGSRDAVSPFVQLLWERGALYEREVVAELSQPFLDLSGYSGDEKETRTREAMHSGVGLIYAGRIRSRDLLGDPDLLRKEDNLYVAGDIKSGAGEEGGGRGDEEKKPKPHYAMQLALYTDALEQLGLSAGRRAFVWDIHGEEVTYDFTALYGKRDPRTLWDDYQIAIAEVRSIVARRQVTTPAYSAGTCKFCVWYSTCIRQLEREDDLTLIPELGRSRREAMIHRVRTIRELAESDQSEFTVGTKSSFSGVGPVMLQKFHARARLISSGGRPYLREPVALSIAGREIFFDVEVDPMRDVCYLHGFLERKNATEHFVAFFAEDATREAEKRAFAEAWAFIRGAQPCTIYFYSKYERTIYRKLCERYPEVCSESEVEALFDPVRAIDLYFDVVLKATEWPTRDFSIKTLAKYLGFHWRDAHPSGAESIEWFHRWLKTRDPLVKRRILEYNEDDCRATRVLLDGLRELEPLG